MTKKKKTGTDWTRLKRMEAGKEPIDTSDIPELDESFWKGAALVTPGGKTRITIRIDTNIYKWFVAQGASGYQTRINSILKAYVNAHKRQNMSDRRKVV